MSRPPARSRRRALASVLTGALIASGAALGVITPAAAAEGDVTGATLDWGVKASFRGYVPNAGGGSIATGGGTTTNQDGTFRWVGGAGELDDAESAADVSYGGSVQFTAHAGELDMVLANPRVAVSGTTGTLYVDVTSRGYNGHPSIDADGMAFATLTPGAPSIAGNVATWTNVPATLTETGAAAFVGFYPAGTALDALTFSLPYQVPTPDPTATATTIAATPAATAVEGSNVTFTATVTPAASGTVQFSTAGGPLGDPVAVADGTATLSTSSLAVGDYEVTATFTPADSAAYVGSTSDTLSYSVTAVPAPDADDTVTSLAIPGARTLLGATIGLTATVTNADDADVTPTGSVEFFRTAAGSTDRVSLGRTSLTDGQATLTTATVPAGGHTFVAVYTPGAAAFLGSESAPSDNHGVIDTSVPATCEPGTAAVTSDTAATVNWSWSAYSSQWTKVAGGNVAVNGQVFALSEGVVRADTECAQISFTGTLRTEAYAGFFPPNGQWIELVDPTLTIAANGTGSWTAGVRTGTGAYDPEASAPRKTVSTFTGQPAGGPGSTGLRSLTPDYGNTVAPGTWSVSGGNWTNAWPAEFILEVPDAIQSFYYQSGTSTANADKPASNFALTFDWPAVTTTAASVAPATRAVLGADVTLSATVAPANVPGTVEFFSTPAGGTVSSLGTAAVVDGTATLVTSTLAAGGHQLTAAFTPSNDFTGSQAQISANYGIVDTSVPQVCAVASDAETLTGVSARWDWSDYSAEWTKVAGGKVAVDGESFVLSGGVARVADGCVKVDFTGTLRTQAYEGFFPPNGQWIELVNPSLVLDAEGNGAWIADVRSGANEYRAGDTVRLTIATVSGADALDFSGDSVNTEIAFDYADTTAPGTWSVAGGVPRTSAWVNEFILAAPASVQAFYYASNAGKDADKPASPLSVNWTAPKAAVTVAGPSGPIVPGSTLTFTGTGFRLGEDVTATVHSDPIVVGAKAADASGSVSFSWTVPMDFPVGAHTVVLNGERSGTASSGFTIAASAVTPAAPAQTEAKCVARAVNGATLTWGVKTSFRTYITGPIAGGSVTTSGVSSADGGFVWSGGSGAYNTDASRGRVGYDGSVTFTGHGGQLSLTIANPRVQVNGGSASLIADLQSKGYNGAPAVNASGVVIASLGLPEASVSGDRISWSGASATLTAAGAEAFGGFYKAGDSLDPVSFTFPLGAEVPCDTTTDGKLASTGADLTGGWLALALLILGAGAVFITRRRHATV